VDRLNERPSSHEGDANASPLDAAVDASSDLAAHGRPYVRHLLPELATRRLNDLAHNSASLSTPRQCVARHLSCALDFLISLLAVLFYISQLAAARSLSVTTLHLASP
jgi:hypothetical protein